MQSHAQCRPTHPLSTSPGRQGLCFALPGQHSAGVESFDASAASTGRRIAILKTRTSHDDNFSAFAFASPVAERRAVRGRCLGQDFEFAEFLSDEFKFFHDFPLVVGDFLSSFSMCESVRGFVCLSGFRFRVCSGHAPKLSRRCFSVACGR